MSHAKGCILEDAWDKPEKWWLAAVSLARKDAPLIAWPEPKCPGCGEVDRVSRTVFLQGQILRTDYLKVSRGRGGPSKGEVAEVCRYLHRWGSQVDNYWLHFAGLDRFTIEVKENNKETN